MHAALVMRDKETDTYWSIMTGDAIAGDLEGTRLEEWPLGEKSQWKELFLYRPRGVQVFYSTLAFVDTGTGFARRDGIWVHLDSGARFDPERAPFFAAKGGEVSRLDGFDTFWFNWSMTHPDTEVLGKD